MALPHPTRARVIIADDDPFIVQLLSEICQAEDMDVRVATNGDQVLEMVIEAPPDLILLDIMMPGMNGFQVLEEMSCMPRMRDISVIVISAVSDNESIRKGYQLGARDYFIKPFRIVELVSRLRTHLMATAYQKLPGTLLDRQVGDAQQLEQEIARMLGQPGHGSLSLLLASLPSRAAGEEGAGLLGRQPLLGQVAPPLRLEVRGVDRLFVLPPDRLVFLFPPGSDGLLPTVQPQLCARLQELLREAGLPGEGEARWTLLVHQPGMTVDLDAPELLKKLEQQDA